MSLIGTPAGGRLLRWCANAQDRPRRGHAADRCSVELGDEERRSVLTLTSLMVRARAAGWYYVPPGRKTRLLTLTFVQVALYCSQLA